MTRRPGRGSTATGKIALVSRGVCPFVDKSRAAFAAGAVGMLAYNNVADENEGLGGNLGASRWPTPCRAWV